MPMPFNLTEGAITALSAGKNIDKPVLQILGIKLIPGSTERHRLLVSDGARSHSFAMLATQLNDYIHRGELATNAVVRIEKYICNEVQNDNNSCRRVLIILDISILHTADTVGGKIGNPILISSGNNPPSKPSEPASSSAMEASHVPPPSTVNASKPVNNYYQSPQVKIKKESENTYNGYGANSSSSISSHSPQKVFPISSLTPYQNRWKIRARVCSKSGIRTWSNSRGTGKLFSFDLIDSSGEIKVAAFNDQCDKFFDLIELNKVYYVSNGILKTANKSYSSIKNDYEMSLKNDSVIELCNEACSELPTIQFSFSSIGNLLDIAKDAVIDVIGVCKSVGDLQTITTRSTNREVLKRDISLVDQTNKEVSLTLWGAEAENFDGTSNPVIAIKGVRVSDFAGRSLSTINSSTIQINPDMKEAYVLRGWYDQEGMHADSQSISVRGSQAGGSGFASNWKVLSQIISDNLGLGDKPDFFTCTATVVMVRKENCMYMACPSQNCNKKVIDLNNGRYRCEKCSQEFDNFKWRLLLTVNIADHSGSQWVTCFQEAAESILGVQADELGRLRETNENAYQNVFNNANFRCFVFKLRTKMESFNDENRLKTTVISATPVDFKDIIKKLISELKDE